MTTKKLRIGSGSAYANDRLEPVRELVAHGNLNYLGFDCLAERTMALAHVRKRNNPKTGQDERIHEVVDVVAPLLRDGGHIIGNFGAANLDAALTDFADSLRRNDLAGTRVGVVSGDDASEVVKQLNVELPEMGVRARDLGDRIVSANAYIGAAPVLEALEGGAQVVFGGRIADPSLFVAPICHELGWDLDDWERVGNATMAGHLLECGVHGAGGNFEDPPYRVIPDPHNLGLPIAEIEEGRVVVTKLPGSGGLVDDRVIKSQLYYEIHDPAKYLTPDVTADFSQLRVRDLGDDRVEITGARGARHSEQYKVLVGVDMGWRAVGEISFGGPGCVDRAKRAAEIVRKRLEPLETEIDELLIDLHGYNTLYPAGPEASPSEVRLRVAGRSFNRGVAKQISYEAEYLYFGPAGAGGATGSVTPALGVTPAFVPRESLNLEAKVVTV